LSRYHNVDFDFAYRIFYPSTVYVISSSFGKDSDALSAVWVTPVSLKPPKVGVVVSPERYTYSLIRKSKLFAVNKLPFRYTEHMAFVGDVSKRYQNNKMEASGLHFSEGRTEGLKAIREAEAVVECGVDAIFEAGDHDIIVGKVLEAYATDAFGAVWDLDAHIYSSYVGSVGEGERAKRIFVSSKGEIVETRWPRTEPVFKRIREQKAIEQAALSYRGSDIHVAAKGIAEKLHADPSGVLMILEEARRQGRARVTGRLLPTDFA